jgi:hypothetical protein
MADWKTEQLENISSNRKELKFLADKPIKFDKLEINDIFYFDKTEWVKISESYGEVLRTDLIDNIMKYNYYICGDKDCYLLK